MLAVFKLSRLLAASLTERNSAGYAPNKGLSDSFIEGYPPCILLNHVYQTLILCPPYPLVMLKRLL